VLAPFRVRGRGMLWDPTRARAVGDPSPRSRPRGSLDQGFRAPGQTNTLTYQGVG